MNFTHLDGFDKPFPVAGRSVHYRRQSHRYHLVQHEYRDQLSRTAIFLHGLHFRMKQEGMKIDDFVDELQIFLKMLKRRAQSISSAPSLPGGVYRNFYRVPTHRTTDNPFDLFEMVSLCWIDQ